MVLLLRKTGFGGLRRPLKNHLDSFHDFCFPVPLYLCASFKSDFDSRPLDEDNVLAISFEEERRRRSASRFTSLTQVRHVK